MLKIRAMSAPRWDGVEFLLVDKVGDKTGIAKSIEFEVDENYPSGNILEPTFKLQREQAQLLMDDLWNCGLRPSEGTGSAGALVATQKHLEDMRKLVFKE